MPHVVLVVQVMNRPFEPKAKFRPLVLELVINRKTAKALGIALPTELLLRADRVID